MSLRRLAISRPRRATLVRLVVTLVCAQKLAAAPATAQTLPRLELAAEYADAMVRHDIDREHYHGFGFQSEVYLHPQIAIMARMDAAYWSFVPPNSTVAQNTKRLYGVLGGVMVTGNRDRLAVPFARTLVGMMKASSMFMAAGGPARTSSAVPAVQFGAGVDVRVTRDWSFRGTLDTRIAGSQPAVVRRNPDLRFGAGVVFRPRR